MPIDPAIQALGTTPIPGAEAVGQSARYEPEFERLQAEIDKLTALSGAAPDWQAVLSDSSAVLAGKSKDLMAASYLCAALRETRGWAGLADGLNLIKTMLATFWEPMHPAKLRARKAAIDWLLDRMKSVLERVPVGAGERADAEACLALIDGIVAFGEGRWENDPPTVWALGQIIKDKVAAIPAAPVAAGKPAAPGNATGSPAGGPGAVAYSLPPAGAPAGRAEAYRQIIVAAEFLTALEPHSPVPYLLRRAASWGGMSLPELYAELQRTGTAWDLVLAGLPGGSGGGSSGSPAAAAPAAASAAPQGDF